MDQTVRLQIGDRHVRVAETDPDHWHPGATGHADIGSGVADHDAGFDLTAGARHGLAENGRIGLLDAKSVRAADRREPAAQVELVQEPLRQPFQLVRADSETMALGREQVERLQEPSKGRDSTAILSA